MAKPEFLLQGDHARLFPALANTSKEGRTTSIVLACLANIREFRDTLLATAGGKVGARSRIEAFTEVVFSGQPGNAKDRPDGLIVVTTGKNEWKALLETKIGSSRLEANQIEKYRALAKENGIDCVITISNQFATSPAHHPLEETRKSRSRIPVFHWSWMFVLTTADLLVSREDVSDTDQAVLLNELRRFLTHESAGVKGFDRMPPEWKELNRQVSAGARILAKSPEAAVVLEAWHQETKDLSLILSRQTETTVLQKLSRKHSADPVVRHKDELARLREKHQLFVELEIPDAAAPLEIVADITRRTVDVGMTLKAPDNKVSSKARVNWLLRQIKSEKTDDLFIRLKWPGRSVDTQFAFVDLDSNPALCNEGKEGQQVSGFHLFYSRRLGAKFTQQANFISELEGVVPEFYQEIGQELRSWHKPAPRIKPEKVTPEEVSIDSIGEEEIT